MDHCLPQCLISSSASKNQQGKQDYSLPPPTLFVHTGPFSSFISSFFLLFSPLPFLTW